MPVRRNSAKSRLVRSTTPAQSPGDVCRTNLAVGYQGVVSMSCIHRQSASCGSRIQTGLPIAPAK